MIEIHTLLVGQPQTITDERGTWRSAIFRQPVAGPVALSERGLAGDQVADTEHHGTPGQAVCCHPLAHFVAWNADYGLEGAARLGPGAVGENWTIAGATERDVCVGDAYRAGAALVEVSGPRYPCTKQERKLGLADFHKQTIATLRTGFYLRVLEPGLVAAGDRLELVRRPHPAFPVHQINVWGHHQIDPEGARLALELPELAAVWKYVLQVKLKALE